MGTYPLEAILSNSENKAAYNILSSNFESIVPYIGTGLSFYCKSWGAPFEGALKALEESALIADVDFQNRLSDAQKDRWRELAAKSFPYENTTSCTSLKDILNLIIDVINCKREKGEKLKSFRGTLNREKVFRRFNELLKDKYFLELGELLNATSLVLTGETFNKKFDDSLNAYREDAKLVIECDHQKIEGLTNEENISQLPQSIWFLPYIGGTHKFIITTNCDDSIEQTFYSLLTDDPNFYSGLNSVTEIKLDANHHNIIYHIHGIQKDLNTDATTSYIMTWSDYRRAYNDGEGSPIRILEHYFTERHYLFIGASLDQDITLEKMKDTTSRESATNRHVALMATKPEDETVFRERRIALHRQMATQTIAVPDYNAYSVILCQLIRERRKEWHVYSEIGEAGSKVCPSATTCAELNTCENLAICKAVNEVMENTEVFSVGSLSISEQELTSKLYPALYKYVYEDYKKRARTFTWSVCRVDTDSFAFPMEQKSAERDREFFHLDTYSAPLGNTIYIIGGNRCTDEKVKELTKKIEKWTKLHTRESYWTQDVRVRVFQISCTGELNPEELLDEIRCIIDSTDCEEEKKEKIFELLKRLCGYKMYKSLFNIDNLINNFFELDSSLILDALLINMLTSNIFRHLRKTVEELRNRKSLKELGSKNFDMVAEAEYEQLDSSKTEELGEKKTLTLKPRHSQGKDR